VTLFGASLGWKLIGGLYLAWGLGANDSAKIFAPAIATNSIRYRTAIMLIAVFVILGAVVQGPSLYEHYTFDPGIRSAEGRATAALIATSAAAVAVMVSTIIGMPVSTSQAAVGALVGVCLANLGFAGLDYRMLGKMMTCWIATPPAAALLSYALYHVLSPVTRRLFPSAQRRNRFLRWSLLIFGCYEAFALGANNVVVTTGPFYQAGQFGPPGADADTARLAAAFAGSAAIAFGALTYGHRVIETMGRKVTVLDPYSAWIVAIATGTTMELFTILKVPVSITQAGVGALIGVGLTKGLGGISLTTLKRIAAAWVTSPLTSGFIAWAACRILAAAS
jgi:PiT family inorganic phosphate transporter